jgi:hypothetical protein
MDGLERSFVDLAKELRAGGQLPGSPAEAAATSATSAAPGGGTSAVPSAAAAGGVTVAAPGGVVASAGPMGAPPPFVPGLPLIVAVLIHDLV